MRNALSQKEFVELFQKIGTNKLAIQEKLKSGTSMVELAAEYNVALTTMKSALDLNEIENGRALKKKPVSQNAIITVLRRLCKAANVDCSELE